MAVPREALLGVNPSYSYYLVSHFVELQQQKRGYVLFYFIYILRKVYRRKIKIYAPRTRYHRYDI